ncbi:hypothetical protein B7463_g6055, partial [Scytalidium lignicola]
MTKLVSVTRSTEFTHSTLGYVKKEHQKVLYYLFKSYETGVDQSKDILHTLSAGAAMIGLAAAANGANVVVEWVKNDHAGVIVPDDRPARYEREPPRVIRLWLSQPPSTILKTLPTLAANDRALPQIPVFGGMMEISSHVSRTFSCSHSTEVGLALWKEAVAMGQQANWRSTKGFDNLGFDQKLSFALTD